MSFNSGTFTLDGGSDRFEQEFINNDDVNYQSMDAQFLDVANGINLCFPADGSKVATGNWDMGGNNFLNIGGISGNLSVSGTFSVTGTTTLQSTQIFQGLTVYGTTTTLDTDLVLNGGNITGAGDVTCTGQVTADNLAVANGGSLDGTFTGDIALTDNIDMSSASTLRIPFNTVLSSSAVGVPGQISWDASYIYLCVGANSWKRVSLDSF